MQRIAAPLVAIILGTFMVILDTTVVNVAVPSLAKSFNSNLHTLQWVLTGYLLAQAAVIPLAGWLSDRFGAKRIFLIAVALFTIGSALCATAQSADMLIFFRVLQGLGGGFVMPIGMAFVYRLSPPEKRGIVMGMLGVPIMLAPAFGPTISGWLVQYADWRWIFTINLPVGALALLLGLRFLPTVERKGVPGLDLLGMALGPLAFALLSYGVNEGATSWTSVNTLAGLIGGGLALLTFVIVELKARTPLLELRVFRSFDFSLAVVIFWITYIGMFGGIFLVPLFLQQVRGYGPFDTGLILMAQAGTAAVFMPIGGRLFDRLGVRPLAIVGLAVMAVGTFLLTRLSATTSGETLVPALMLRGAGVALVMMPLNTHILNAAPRNLVSRVTSLTQALQSVVGSLAIAGLSTIVTSQAGYIRGTALLVQAAKHGTPAAPAAGTGVVHLPPAVATLFASAFNTALSVATIAVVVGILLSFALRRNPPAQAADAPSSTGPNTQPALEMMAG
jgi:EmrB/QacA subfamily drug resistance transporter